MKTHLHTLFYILSLGVVSSSEASQRWLSRGVDHHLWENGIRSHALKTTFRYCHTKHPLTHRGIYSHPTEDAIFKYLMHDAEVRNSFLQSMLGETITSSDILDTSLNPVKSYKALRQLVTDKNMVKLMEDIDGGKKKIEVRNEKNQKQLSKVRDFLVQLAPLYYELVQALPDLDRNTQLDLVCNTPSGIINVEMQVDPQDFWDIRILHHVCGLFYRQFPKGFAWSQLETGLTSTKVKRVIGISLFEKAPIAPDSVQAILPWYSMKPWSPGELRRHYKLTDTGDHTMHRAGIEFLDYNFEALRHSGWDKGVSGKNKTLREWLYFFAEAHTHSLQDVKKSVKSKPVQKAYHMIESSMLPQKVKDAYEEDMKRRYNISHYVEDKVKKGQEEGKNKTMDAVKKALFLIKQGQKDDAFIAKEVELTPDEVRQLR